MGKRCHIIITNDTETHEFDTRKEAAEFLGLSITAMVYNEWNNRITRGYKITFKNYSEGCIVCGGVVAQAKDEYCSECYYKETTGHAMTTHSTSFGAKQATDIIKPYRG